MLSTEPLDLALDTDGDLLLVDGDLAFTSGVAGVAQGCRLAIETYKGEWFLNIDAGIPYYQSILGQKYNASVIQSAFRSVLALVPGVASVTKVNSEWNGTTRETTITWEVLTEFDDVVTDTFTLVA